MIIDQNKLEEQGYFNLRHIEGRGLCGLFRFNYTIGLVYGMTNDEYIGRYCYYDSMEAKQALKEWNGIKDPDGNWIKHKGSIEYSNPNYKK